MMRLESFLVIVCYFRLQSVSRSTFGVFIREYFIPIPPVDRLWSKTAKKSTRNQFSAPYYGGLLTAER